MNDFPSGPLDAYRKAASFDWKKLKIFLDTKEVLIYQNALYKELEQHPVFFSARFKTLPLDEERRVSTHRLFALLNLKSLRSELLSDNPGKPLALFSTLFQMDPSVIVKYSVAFGIFPLVLSGLGTERHLSLVKSALKGQILGCYCLTEITHGSNAKGIETTATYDKSSREFILHTPNFKAAKCWSGLLGQMATHAIVYAQLITPNGVNHGLHAFVAKIRDQKTFQPYAGITIGDMGEKIGLNGSDNGYVIFKQYRIPRTALLNKLGDVTEDGRYVSPYRDRNKRYSASLGSLSLGRINILVICSTYLNQSLTIALRYAAVRKQFAINNQEELPILEYQTHQYRLIPYLAMAYVMKVHITHLTSHCQSALNAVFGININNLADLGMEVHAISCASKSVFGWIVRDAVNECREACGGFGYLKAAGIGDIRNDHDANCTYEGDNYVILQQTSNWLLKFWPKVAQGQAVSSPFQSIDFLTNAREILNAKCSVRTVEELIAPKNLLNMYKWLVVYHLKMSHEKYVKLLELEHLDAFSARNESQIFFCKNLAISYIQHYMMHRMYVTISQATDPQIKDVLTRLLSLYGVWSLEKHAVTFYQGGYVSGSLFADLMNESILKLCRNLKNDAVALIDVIAPPDFLMKSVLGRSDGQIYKHLEAAVLQASEGLARPKWWKEIRECQDKIKSKL